MLHGKGKTDHHQVDTYCRLVFSYPEALCRAVLAAVSPFMDQSRQTIAAAAFSNACRVFRVPSG